MSDEKLTDAVRGLVNNIAVMIKKQSQNRFAGEVIHTRSIREKNKTGTKFEVLNIKEGSGKVIRFLMISGTAAGTDNKAYSIKIIADNNILYDDTYANFEAESATILSLQDTNMLAYEDGTNNYYIFFVKDIYFNKNILIEVDSNSATFDVIRVIWDERIPIPEED